MMPQAAASSPRAVARILSDQIRADASGGPGWADDGATSTPVAGIMVVMLRAMREMEIDNVFGRAAPRDRGQAVAYAFRHGLAS